MRVVLWAFLGVLGVLVSLLIAFRGAQLGPDVFANGERVQLVRINQLEDFDRAAIKGFHGRNVAPYDIGLFGSSHIVQVSAGDVDVKNARLFNFAVTGSSFRQSVALLEHLEAAGKAPAVAVISLDNFTFPMVENAFYPGLFERLAIIAGDALGLHRRAQYLVALRAVHNGVASEWELFKAVFSFQRILSRLSFWYPDLLPAMSDARLSYRRDGSRQIPPRESWNRAMPVSHKPFKLFEANLRRDLQRLAALRDRGRTILIYESPLSPELNPVMAEGTLLLIEKSRKLFAGICSELALQCRLAPSLSGGGTWGDCCHAPPRELGQFITSFIGRRALVN
jgi:hypothetical protein